MLFTEIIYCSFKVKLVWNDRCQSITKICKGTHKSEPALREGEGQKGLVFHVGACSFPLLLTIHITNILL